MDRRSALRSVLVDPVLFARHVCGREMRGYQAEPLRAIARCVASGEGGAIALMFSRQAGKNEVSAHFEAWALARYSAQPGAQIVKTAPTLRPQLTNSVLRLERVLRNRLLAGRAHRDGAAVVLGGARVMFLSGSRTSNVVGATASLALEFDEAQDLDVAKHDRDFMPMAATTNAPRVYYGTAWTDDTLLARVLEELRGTGRAFVVPWDRVAAEVPTYGRFVEAERARLGADHPMFRTQYLLETIAGAGRLLAARQLALLRGRHARQREPGDGVYVAGVDVAGGDDGATVSAGRDSTVVTIGRVGSVELVPGLAEPVLEVVEHVELVGVDPRAQYGELVGVLGSWGVQRCCVDATGVGAGMASVLTGALGASVVEAFTFTGASKSALGFALLAGVNAGRVRMYSEPSESAEAREFWREAKACRYEMAPGALMRFSVPEDEGHDDYVMSLALALRAAGDCTVAPAGETLVRRPYAAGQRW